MDRPGADFERSLESIRTRLGATPAPITMPVGSGETLAGVIDLIAMEMLVFDPADQGRTVRRAPIPDDLQAEAEVRRHDLVELVVEHGEAAFARVYSGTLKQGQGLWNPRLGRHERAMRLLRMHANEREPVEEAVAGDIVALVGLKDTATGDTLCDKKAPIVLEAMHFAEPVMSMRIEPRTNADRDRLTAALATLAREDPTFRVKVSADTGETL